MTDLASLISSSLYHRSLSWQTVCLGSLSCCTMKVWPMRLKDLPDKMCQYTSEFIQLLLPSSMKTLSQLPETATHAKAMPSPSFTDEFELFGFLSFATLWTFCWFWSHLSRKLVQNPSGLSIFFGKFQSSLWIFCWWEFFILEKHLQLRLNYTSAVIYVELQTQPMQVYNNIL